MGKKNPADRTIKQKAGVLILAGLLLLSVVLWMIRREEVAVSFLERPAVGNRSENLVLNVRPAEGDSWIWQGEVTAQIYSEEEVDACMELATELIRERLPRPGESLDQVRTGVNLMEEVPEADVSVIWRLSGQDLLDRDGNVRREGIQGEGILELTAELQCQGRKEIIRFPIRLVPSPLSEEEQYQQSLREELDRLSAKKETEEILELPTVWEGKEVFYYLEKENRWWVLPLLAVGVLLLLQVHGKEEERTREKERIEAILLQYPQFVSRFVVLLGAGMNLASVWTRLAAEYEERQKRGGIVTEPLYEEVYQVAIRLHNGEQERRVYEEFGKKTGVPTCQRFASVLTQNLRMGSERILEQLEYEAVQAMEERKNQARSRGEQMGTKLLLPMMVQLLLVLALILLPAFVTL